MFSDVVEGLVSRAWSCDGITTMLGDSPWSEAGFDSLCLLRTVIVASAVLVKLAPPFCGGQSPH